MRVDDLTYEELMADRTPDPVIPFSTHRGKYARQCPVGYLDWLIGQDWLRPQLKCEIEAHLETRAEWHRLADDD